MTVAVESPKSVPSNLSLNVHATVSASDAPVTPAFGIGLPNVLYPVCFVDASIANVDQRVNTLVDIRDRHLRLLQ
jgi:hypothetical protein